MIFFFVIFFVDFWPTFDIMSAERLRSEPKRYMRNRGMKRESISCGDFFFVGNPGRMESINFSRPIFPFDTLSPCYPGPFVNHQLFPFSRDGSIYATASISHSFPLSPACCWAGPRWCWARPPPRWGAGGGCGSRRWRPRRPSGGPCGPPRRNRSRCRPGKSRRFFLKKNDNHHLTQMK